MADLSNLPSKDGFKEPYEYPISGWIQYGFSAVLFIVVTALLFEKLAPIFSVPTSPSIVLFIAVFYVLNAVNLHLHERVHFLVGSLLGYEPEISIPWHHLDGYANAPGQFVDANHNVINLLSPLTFLGFLYALGLLADVHWGYALILAVLLISNITGSAADIIGAFFDYRLPEGSLVYYPDTNDSESFIYEPRG